MPNDSTSVYQKMFVNLLVRHVILQPVIIMPPVKQGSHVIVQIVQMVEAMMLISVVLLRQVLRWYVPRIEKMLP